MTESINKIKRRNRFLAGFLTLALVLTLGAGICKIEAKAASGTVYTCVINRCYAHPVTGEIEDSGGEAAYATGQGMVEGCLYATGIMEVTDSGEYYLTIRMSLMDYTSGHSFWVQNVNDSGWSVPASMGITGNGTDTNGATSDICIQVPSENCVVRGSMYVEPMGRDVIFYCYPSDYSAGNTTDMTATIVTEAAGSQTVQETTAAQTTQSAAAQETTAAETTEAAQTTQADQETTQAPSLESSIKQAASPTEAAGTDTDEEALGKAQGLSLSTAGEVSETETAIEAAASSGSNAFAIGAAITISGLILMSAAAGYVYLFRKNWYRWGGGEDDEED